jgi:hypothetical protein
MRKYIVFGLAALLLIAFSHPTRAINWTFTDNVTVQGAGGITVTQGAFGGQVTLREAAANGTEYRAIRAPDALSVSLVFLLPSADPTANQVMIWSAPSAGVSTGTWAANGAGGGGSGDVVGPGSATNNAITLFDGATGKLIKNSPVTVGTDNVMTGMAGVGTAHADNTARIEIMNTGPPGTCDASRHGWTYYDNTAKTYQVCDSTAWRAIPTVVAVPGTASTACVAGVIAFDTSNAYFCVAANTWRRVGISTW